MVDKNKMQGIDRTSNNRCTEWRGEHAAVADRHTNYIDKLALYEDSGQTPEEVTANTEELTRYRALGSIDRLRELVQADAAGHLWVFPCKVGDTAWYITSWLEICKAEVTNLEVSLYSDPRMWITLAYDSERVGPQEYHGRVDIGVGRFVFFSREEAVKALEGDDEE